MPFHSDLFVIIACDGVWDVISNDEAVVLIYGQLIQTCQTYQAKSSLLTDDDIRSISAQACDKLLSECLQRQTNDNMTALLVLFPLMSSILKEMYQTSHTSIYSPAYCNSTSKLINSSETSPIGSTTPYDSRIFPTSDKYPYPAPSHSQNLRDRVSPEGEEDADDEDERADSPMKGKKLFS